MFSRILVEDYNYPKSHIITRPQWRVRSRPSDTKKEYPVDIAVFDNHSHADNSLNLIVECKRKTRKDGLEQLEDYLRLSKAKLGVWFNGKERLFIRKFEKDGEVKFQEIPNIPRYGQRIEDVGKFARKDLVTPHNLKSVFQVIRNHLAGNTVGTTRDEELARQLINLIFCKIYDEKFAAPDDIVEFRAGIDEEPKNVRDRIHALFEKVKQKYAEVISVADEIVLDDKSLVYIVGELQNFCIIDAQRDAVADAFETFIGYALKGGQGQFFTPRNVVQLMVQIGNPSSTDLVIDPACGSGGFLVESLRHVWNDLEALGKKNKWSPTAIAEEKQTSAIRNFNGLEKDDFLSKVAKAYMAILGDGKGGIFCEDSLEEPKEWSTKTNQHIHLGKYDLVLTNPPFGKDIKVTGFKKLSQYELAKKWKNEDGVPVVTSKMNDEMQPDILFIERCIQLLKDGGRLGIVLPETFFHAPNSKYVMNFMAAHNIYYVIDLPHNTFRPHNNAKCIVIFLKKNMKQQPYIDMAVAEQMGHDHQGKEIYRWDAHKKCSDKSDVWDDVKIISDEIRAKKNTKYTFKVLAKTCATTGIYVPRFFWQQRDQEIRENAESNNFDLKKIEELIAEGVISHFDGHGSPPSENKGNGEVPYIRVKDIVNWEIYKDPTSKIPNEIYESMTTRVKVVDDEVVEITRPKELKVHDIAYVRRGSYRIGSVAMVSPFDIEVLLTREINVIRVNPKNKYGLTAHYLLFALSHNIVKMQTDNKVLIETTLPNIGDRWKQIYIPIPRDKKQLVKITQQIKSVIDLKWQAVSGITNIQKELGNLTT